MENEQKMNPYDAVIADLRSRIAKLESTIQVLEALKEAGIPGSEGIAAVANASNDSPAPETGPGAFFNMTIADATKKLLSAKRRQMATSEIVPELERGGILLTSADKVNTVGSILKRRFRTQGDIVRVARGLWGLQEWYPGRKFPDGKTSKAEEQKADEAAEIDEIMRNEEGTEPHRPVAGNADWLERELSQPFRKVSDYPDSD